MLKVCVPATSANLGPGFDCVGLALNLDNEFYFFSPQEKEIPPGTTLLRPGSLVHRGMELMARTVDQSVPKLNVAIKTIVPRSRGLGSSATLTVAGIVAANILSKANLNEEEIISLATKIEGHPDNAAPALVGGLVLSVTSAKGIKYIKVEPQSPLQVIVAVPDFKLSTIAARKVLPDVVPYQDAVFNTGRFGLLMTSFLTGKYELLKLAMEDRLHQPYRLPLVPGLKEVMAAVISQGAFGSCLSGAGPSVLAFCNQQADLLKKVMEDTWREHGVSAKTYLLEISTEGTKYTYDD
ncbi:MAG TPA: homoserine kinase [Clostridia bacterium]|jgi:homoserine kinase|nr:homoserine kinase [Clostridia bacterium]